MTTPAKPAAAGGYTHTATIVWEGNRRPIHNVPVRRDGRYWVSKHPVHLAMWHAPSDVSNLRPIPERATP
jgi:hypothetical protein